MLDWLQWFKRIEDLAGPTSRDGVAIPRLLWH